MKKKKRKKKIFLITFILTAVVIIAMFLYTESKYKNLIAYSEKLLGIQWDDCIELATGQVKRELWEEDYANIRLEVKEGCEETVLNILRSNFGQPIDPIHMRPYHRSPFAAEIDAGKLQYTFEIDREGKRVKTRSILIFVVYDEENQMCLYWMG